MLHDAWTIIKKSGKFLADKISSDGEIISFDKVNDHFRTNADLRQGLMGDHIEMLKAKYIETKKAVKPVTLYFNMKRMLDEANAFSQESGKQMAKQGSAGNMSKTPTPVPKKTVAAAAPAQKKVGNKENKKDQAKKETP
jgi:hypothetical protein